MLITSLLATSGLLAMPAPPDTVRTAAVADTLVVCPTYDQVQVKGLVFVGNAATKERILRAELDFREGDTLTVATLNRRLEANRRRLFNLQLFHSVTLHPTCHDGLLTILVQVQERWYTFPIPIFSLADRNLRAWYDRPDRWRRVDYGVHVVRYNFRGRNEQLVANLQVGFNQKYELFFESPGRARRPGLALGASLVRSRALDYQTQDDKLLTYRAAKGFAVRREYATIGLRWRNTVQRRTSLDVSWHQEWIADSVRIGNADYFRQGTSRGYAEFRVARTLNHRNTFAYPLTGYYLQVAATQRLYAQGSSPAVSTLYLQASRYWSLPHRLYYSAGFIGQARLAPASLPYADLRALGYTALVRGYDQYVVDGRHYALVQQGLSLALLTTRQVDVGVTNNPKFSSLPLAIYLNTFADAGYVAAPTVSPLNRLPNQLLASVGVGLHLVTYYDRVVTIEYTRTLLGEGGVYVRTEFPI